MIERLASLLALTHSIFFFLLFENLSGCQLIVLRCDYQCWQCKHNNGKVDVCSINTLFSKYRILISNSPVRLVHLTLFRTGSFAEHLVALLWSINSVARPRHPIAVLNSAVGKIEILLLVLLMKLRGANFQLPGGLPWMVAWGIERFLKTGSRVDHARLHRSGLIVRYIGRSFLLFVLTFL